MRPLFRGWPSGTAVFRRVRRPPRRGWFFECRARDGELIKIGNGISHMAAESSETNAYVQWSDEEIRLCKGWNSQIAQLGLALRSTSGCTP